MVEEVFSSPTANIMIYLLHTIQLNRFFHPFTFHYNSSLHEKHGMLYEKS
jgi:hypothetical protein